MSVIFLFICCSAPTLESNARAQEKSGKNDAKLNETVIEVSDSELSGDYLSALAEETHKNGMMVNPIDKRKYARRALRRKKNDANFTDVKL